MAVNLDVDVVEVEEEILEQRQRHLAECPYTSANLSLTLSSIITIIIIPALCSRKSCTFTGICVHSFHSNYKTTQTAAVKHPCSTVAEVGCHRVAERKRANR